jgi:class 3 adenylate cyclase
MAALAAYHELAGPLINRHEGTLERFLGDGIMVLFNDPVPCPDPAARAVHLALELRAGFAPIVAPFQRDGAELGLGIGVAQGVATMGRIGFEGRFDYAAIGSVANLASRLCDHARDGQILVTDEIARAITDLARITEIGAVPFKGFAQPVLIHDIVERLPS